MYCTTCKAEKPPEDFPSSRRGKDRDVCSACKSTYNRNWYNANKTKHAADVQRNHQQYREETAAVLALLKSRPCADCGGTFPLCAMDFDHLDGETKLGNVSTFASRGQVTRLLEEAKKCEVVCANCHRVRTHTRLCSRSSSG